MAAKEIPPETKRRAQAPLNPKDRAIRKIRGLLEQFPPRQALAIVDYLRSDFQPIVVDGQGDKRYPLPSDTMVDGEKW
jgi:hypothetical protein